MNTLIGAFIALFFPKGGFHEWECKAMDCTSGSTAAAALLLGAGAALAATALAADDVDAFVVEPNSVRLTLSIGCMFLVDDVLNIDPFSSAIVYHGLAVPRKVSLLDLRHEGGRE